MRRLVLLILCCVLLSPAFAAAEDFGMTDLSAVLPDKWEAEPQAAEYVTFRTQDGSCEVGVLSRELLLPDAVLWAAVRAKTWKGESSLRAVPGKQGFVFVRSDGGRCWLDTRDGWVLEVSVSGTSAEISSLVQGFQTVAENPGLARMLAALSGSPAVLNWLGAGGAVPGKPMPLVPAPALPDFATFGGSQEGIAPPALPEKLPAGWTASVKGVWGVVLSKNGKQWAVYRDYPVAPEDADASEGSPLPVTMLKVAGLLQGCNFSMSEGMGDVYTPAGFAQMTRNDQYLRVSIYSDQDAVDEVFLQMP